MLFKHLRKIDSTANNNRDYIMEQVDERKFTVSYGRYGAAMMKKPYPISQWDKILAEKLSSGYTDVTDTIQIVVQEVSEEIYKPLENKMVSKLVEKLMSYANMALKKSYKITAKEVSEKMIEMAQDKIHNLTISPTLESFNQTLEELFAILPRKMQDVKEYLAASEEDFNDILEREQDLLDIMSTKVSQLSNSSSIEGEKTILETMGLSIYPCTEEQTDEIKNFLDPETRDKFDSAYRVINKKTESTFKNFCKDNHIGRKDIHYFYHGSRNQNFWSIICNGLKLKPQAIRTGNMFGYGIYFAPLAKKSVGYTSLNGFWSKEHSKEGYLAIFKVAYKKPFDVHSWQHEYSQYTKHHIKAKGCDALFAHAGISLRNDEVIVYDESQCTIQYLIRLK